MLEQSDDSNTKNNNIGFYLLLQGFCNARLSDKDSSKTLGSENYEKSTLTCTCGKFNKSIKKQIPWELADGIYRNELASNSNSNDLYKFIVNIKPFFRNCSVCEVEYSTCPGDQNNLDANSCFKNSVLFSIPQKNHSGNTEGNSSQHHRHVRQADLCAFPTSLATAELKCRIYPSSVMSRWDCNEVSREDCNKVSRWDCNKVSREDCNKVSRWDCNKVSREDCNKVSRWDCHKVSREDCNKVWDCHKVSREDCNKVSRWDSYVDCGVTLISGGKEECSTPTVKEPVSCKITCDHFENEAGGHSTHECDVNGNGHPNCLTALDLDQISSNCNMDELATQNFDSKKRHYTWQHHVI
ncbi:uncharacterized protein CDAR_460701 [Caerostris darwini]|uniref:SRCR domain-containing protein n=1 Tax=Caerostris darwini TaxID=1538125 RepID=A0AAV4PVD6_9ARAC|nr:uncharacterized protein CDAR_460701 [Caerostris darwini]